MTALYYLIPAALSIVIGVVWLFCWAVGSGQYDDLDSPARRILFDDEPTPKERPPSD